MYNLHTFPPLAKGFQCETIIFLWYQHYSNIFRFAICNTEILQRQSEIVDIPQTFNINYVSPRFSEQLLSISWHFSSKIVLQVIPYVNWWLLEVQRHRTELLTFSSTWDIWIQLALNSRWSPCRPHLRQSTGAAWPRLIDRPVDECFTFPIWCVITPRGFKRLVSFIYIYICVQKILE